MMDCHFQIDTPYDIIYDSCRYANETARSRRATMAPPYMDVRIAPLNPCSIETIPIPIRLANGKSVWPMMMSCYELTNNTSGMSSTTTTSSSQPQSSNSIGTDTTTVISSLTHTETSSLTQPSVLSSVDGTPPQQPTPQQQPPQPQHRVGHMDLSLIVVPDNIAHTSSAMPLQFDTSPTTLPQPPVTSKGHTTTIGTAGGGILDGQWSSMPSYMIHHQQQQVGQETSCQNYCFVSAHSTGEIQLHSFQVLSPDDYLELNDGNNNKLIDVQFMGQSTNTTKSKFSATQPPPLCLSVRWDTPAPYKCTTDDLNISTATPTRIVSTYSNGTMAIHDVTCSSNTIQLIERDRWNAHFMYPTNTPAEVWTASFVGDTNDTNNNANIVWSGGDDNKFKIWDIRSTIRPMLSYHDIFDAGITCISPHPTHPNIVAIGSCTF
jgi:hypothetical protein